MHPRQCLQPVRVGQDGYFHKGAYCKTRQFSGKFETQEIERVPEQRWEIKIPDPSLLSAIGKAGITNTHPACLSGVLWLPNEDADRNIHCNV